jgi:hypothetical protein
VWLDLVAQDEVGAGVAGLGLAELLAERGEGLGAPRRGERVEPDEQLAVAGDDVAGDGEGFADEGVGFVAGTGVAAVQGVGEHGFGVVGARGAVPGLGSPAPGRVEPVQADDRTTLAAAHGWLPGPANTTLARPAWWRHHDTGQASTWLQIATRPAPTSLTCSPAAPRPALTGSVQHVTTSFRAQRYQQVVVIVLLGCHDVGQPPPAGLLDQLAEHAAPGLAPRPP